MVTGFLRAVFHAAGYLFNVAEIEGKSVTDADFNVKMVGLLKCSFNF